MSGKSLGELLRLLVREGANRLLTVTGLFSVLAVVGLAVGISLPKRWDAQATLLVEESNIIKPLMEGRAVATGVADQTAIVTRVVLSKKILREILIFGGWLSPPPAPQPSARDEERLVNALRDRIKIDSPRDGLIRIGYHDNDQERSYKIANKLAEIYVREANEAKERESREAFDFIDRQVKEYGQKLTDAHEKVLAYYAGQDAPKATPASDTPTPRGNQEMPALRAEEATLMRQLAKTAPAKAAASDGREERARNRVIDLTAQLEKLQLTLTDAHPDVVRTKRELAAAQEELTSAQKAAAERQMAAEAATALDDEVTAAAKARLERVRHRIAALGGTPIVRRVEKNPIEAAEKVDPDMRSVGLDATLSELLRRYEATRDIYQDLLKRRENARVSMLLDAEGRGMSMRIQEPAEMPVIPSSLRLMHVTLIALVVAALIPLGFLLAIVMLDKRVRSPDQILRQAKVPLLVSIQYQLPSGDKDKERSRRRKAILMLAGVVTVYAIAFIIKLKTTS